MKPATMTAVVSVVAILVNAGTSYADMCMPRADTHFADVDGDGKADAIVINRNFTTGAGNILVRRSDGNRFLPLTETWSTVAFPSLLFNPYNTINATFFADVTGDGKADAIHVGLDRITVRRSIGNRFDVREESWTIGPFFGDQRTFIADVNGDGKADGVVSNSTGITVRLSDGNQFLPNQPGTFTAFAADSVADVTGDGRADAIQTVAWGTSFGLSFNGIKVLPAVTLGGTFVGFGSEEWWTTNPHYGNVGTFFADVTGDHRADAIMLNSNGITVRPSGVPTTRGFLGEVPFTADGFFGGIGTYFADVTGDGRADVIAVNLTGIEVGRASGSGWWGDPWRFSSRASWTGRFFGDTWVGLSCLY